MAETLNPSDARPEEIVLEIYRQLLELRGQGMSPDRVYLSTDFVKRLRGYRVLLGEAENPEFEYLNRDSIFGLEFYVHQNHEIRVSDR